MRFTELRDGCLNIAIWAAFFVAWPITGLIALYKLGVWQAIKFGATLFLAASLYEMLFRGVIFLALMLSRPTEFEEDYRVPLPLCLLLGALAMTHLGLPGITLAWWMGAL